jgi:hypothetical protein
MVAEMNIDTIIEIFLKITNIQDMESFACTTCLHSHIFLTCKQVINHYNQLQNEALSYLKIKTKIKDEIYNENRIEILQNIFYTIKKKNLNVCVYELISEIGFTKNIELFKQFIQYVKDTNQENKMMTRHVYYLSLDMIKYLIKEEPTIWKLFRTDRLKTVTMDKEELEILRFLLENNYKIEDKVKSFTVDKELKSDLMSLCIQYPNLISIDEKYPLVV